jgi:hypothetical protein
MYLFLRVVHGKSMHKFNEKLKGIICFICVSVHCEVINDSLDENLAVPGL